MVVQLSAKTQIRNDHTAIRGHQHIIGFDIPGTHHNVSLMPLPRQTTTTSNEPVHDVERVQVVESF